jgi:benzoyl-CoA reductase/2-hydroxyglutaryl-CoA dehydratase subunit BcrC/BadD/HgdB
MAISDVMPKPAAIVHTSQPCDNTLAQGNALADYYGVKAFILDSPYYENEDAYNYFAKQIKEGFKYLEEMTGKKLDIDRFREVMQRSQRTHELLWEINELKKKKPCPIPTGAVLRQLSVGMYMQTGSESLVAWLEKHLEDATERSRRGIGGENEEKIRTAWIYAWPSFDWAIYDWLGQKYGAIPVIFQASEYFYRPKGTGDFDELCKSLAVRILSCPMGRSSRGHLDYFVRDAVYWCREWSVDAAIFAGHLQCKANWSVAQITKETLMDELGVPLLSFVVDALDPRVTSTEQMLGYLEPFLEMVSENKDLQRI